MNTRTLVMLDGNHSTVLHGTTPNEVEQRVSRARSAQSDAYYEPGSYDLLYFYNDDDLQVILDPNKVVAITDTR